MEFLRKILAGTISAFSGSKPISAPRASLPTVNLTTTGKKSAGTTRPTAPTVRPTARPLQPKQVIRPVTIIDDEDEASGFGNLPTQQVPRRSPFEAPKMRPRTSEDASVPPLVSFPVIEENDEDSEFRALVPIPEINSDARSRLTRIRLEDEDPKLLKYSKWEGEVLTSFGGSIKVDDSTRLLSAYLADGTLLVARHDPVGTKIMALKQSLKQLAKPVLREYAVSGDFIKKIYESAEKRSGQKGHSRGVAEMQAMQQQFLRLVGDAAERRCSDIHVTVGRQEAEIRVRCYGVMEHVRSEPSRWASELCASAFAMADASDASYRSLEYQFARVSDIRTPLPEGVQSVRLQFNPLPNGGRYMVCRLLYATSSADQGGDIDTLGYNKVHIEQITRMRKMPFGMNIISGPTGSGKSTTLQRALTALMREKRGQVNVITIEDPPEFVIVGAAQLPVLNATTDEERNEKFRQAISASLRSDPDVIMIGEIRDRASSSLAFSAAMTGHQVWASLHANTAISILDRLKDHGVEDYKLTDHTLVTGLIGQRLIRRLCDSCKLNLEDAKSRGIIDLDLGRMCLEVAGPEMTRDVRVANSDGCPECRAGYAGRMVIAECVLPDIKFMEYMKNNEKQVALDYWLRSLNGLTILEHAIQKMVRGLCDPRDVEDKGGELFGFDNERREIVFGKLFT